MPPTPKFGKKSKVNHQETHHFKVSGQADFRFGISVKSYLFKHWSTLMLVIFGNMLIFETYNLKQLINIEFFRRWDYEKAISHGRKLLGAYIKGWKTTFLTSEHQKVWSRKSYFSRVHEPANPRPHANFRKNMSQKALNRILTLPNYSTSPGLPISSRIIDLHNIQFCEQFKHCKLELQSQCQIARA